MTAINRAEKIIIGLALLLLALSAYMHVITGYVGDKNWLLVAAHMVLSGKRLYVDVFESNPPLIIWIFMLPVHAAESLHASDYKALSLMGIALVALSVCVCWRIIRGHSAFADDYRRQGQFALLLALVFIAFTTPTYFADREHILLVLSLPYVLRLMPSVARAPISWQLRVVIGVMAGIGFCIKPHTIIIFAGLQLFYLLRYRSTRILFTTENLCIYALAIGYLLAAKQFASHYFSDVLPVALPTYSAYSNGHISPIYLVGAAFILAMTFVDFRWRATSPYRRDIGYLLSVNALWLCYALANNGWGYTYNPLISMLLVTSGFVFWEQSYLKTANDLKGLPSKPSLQGMRACLLLLVANAAIALYTFVLVFTTSCNDFESCQSTQKLEDYMREKHITTYGALTINYHILPMLYRETGAELQTRFNGFWMLPRFFKSDETFTEQHRWILAYVANAFAQDLTQNKPQLVLVNSDIRYKRETPIDLPKYFSVYPEFKNAWTHYRLVEGPNIPKPNKDFPYYLYERIP